MANTTSAPNHSGARGLSSREALVSVLESLRAVARRHSRVPHEADDLLQDALLEAMRVGRADLTQAVELPLARGYVAESRGNDSAFGGAS